VDFYSWVADLCPLSQERWIEIALSCAWIGWWGGLRHRLHLLSSPGSNSTTKYLQQQRQVLDPTHATYCKNFDLQHQISDRDFTPGSRAWWGLHINLLLCCSLSLLSITFLQPTQSMVGLHKPSSKESFMSQTVLPSLGNLHSRDSGGCIWTMMLHYCWCFFPPLMCPVPFWTLTSGLHNTMTSTMPLHTMWKSFLLSKTSFQTTFCTVEKTPHSPAHGPQ